MKNEVLEFLLKYMQKHSDNKYTLPQIAKAVLNLKLDNEECDSSLLKQIKDECFDYMVGMNEDYKEYLASINTNELVANFDAEKFDEYMQVSFCHQMCEKAIKADKLQKLAKSCGMTYEEENVL